MIWFSKCEVLFIEYINNKALMYITGNYIQYPIINHYGKEYVKEKIYVYLNHNRNEHNTVNQLYLNTF